jgi:orotidine-5'-phosphate decarboxylase
MWVRRLKGEVGIFKVGLELFLAEGWQAVQEIGEEGCKVFLDVKLLDVPRTVAAALKSIHERLGSTVFATIHVLNSDALKAAVEARKAFSLSSLRILVVTWLTSMDEEDLKKLGSSKTVEDYVLGVAAEAITLGADGVISSGLEAGTLRDKLGENFFIVTPGVRPAGQVVDNDDQKRVVTPRAAVLSGADYIVVGRPIRNAANPLEVVANIKAEIAAGLRDRARGGSPSTSRVNFPPAGSKIEAHSARRSALRV